METIENENGVTYVRCSGCKCLRNEKDEFEIYEVTRRKTCIICKDNREKLKCEHGKYKPTCKECGGGFICIHNRRNSVCFECGGSGLCTHNKQKSQCQGIRRRSNLHS